MAGTSNSVGFWRRNGLAGCAIALLISCLSSVPAHGSGMTTHSVMADIAARDTALTRPELFAFLALHRNDYQNGVFMPDQALAYFQSTEIKFYHGGFGWTNLFPKSITPLDLGNNDNLTHGNKDGYDGIINGYLDALAERCPDGIESSEPACRRGYAFLFGIVAHNVGDGIPHDQYMVDMAEHFNLPADFPRSVSPPPTCGHLHSDINLDICLARILNGQFDSPVVFRPMEKEEGPCSSRTGSQFSDGTSCYKCASGYSRVLDLSLLKGTPFENASIPVCYKYEQRCTAGLLDCDLGEVVVPGGCGLGSEKPHKCFQYLFRSAENLGSICPSGQHYEVTTNSCYQDCAAPYRRNLLALPDTDYACSGEVLCLDVDTVQVGMIPPLIKYPINITAPTLVTRDLYEDAQTAWARDPEFYGDTHSSRFTLGDLTDVVDSNLHSAFWIEHLPLPAARCEVDAEGNLNCTRAGFDPCSIGGLNCLDPIYVSFKGDPLGFVERDQFVNHDWAFRNAFNDNEYITRAARDIQNLMEALWDGLHTGRVVRVKRNGPYKYMVVVDDRVTAQNHVRGDDGINYATTWTQSGAGRASGIDLPPECASDTCFGIKQPLATPFPGEELLAWEPEECGAPFLTDRTRTCKAVFTTNHPPTTTAAIDPQPNANGWNSGDVTVRLHSEIWEGHLPVESGWVRLAGDQCAGPAATRFCDAGGENLELTDGSWPPILLPAEGVTSLMYRAIDGSNVKEEQRQVDIRIDRTPPTVSIQSPTEGEILLLNEARNAVWSCSDDIAGIDSCAALSQAAGLLDTSSVGPKSFEVTATDRAGHVVTDVRSYTVHFAFNGFLTVRGTALDADPQKAGGVLVGRFRLEDASGQAVSDPASVTGFRSSPISCDAATPPQIDGDEVALAGGDGFTYVPGTGSFMFRWKTDRTWRGTCRILQVNLADGATPTVKVTFD